MEEQQLPPGYRFYPTEDELISFYLHHKLHGLEPQLDRVIPSIDIYNFEPHQLPGLAGELSNGDTEQWFFFSPRQEREARGGRPNRTTVSGYWKATGSPSYVHSSENNRTIGMKKTMVFYKGKAPTGRKTKWKMNEYKALKLHTRILNNPNSPSTSTTTPELRHELSLCRVYITSGCARAFDRRPPGSLLLVPNNTINNNSQNAIPNSSKEDRQAEGNLTANSSLQENIVNNATFLLEKCSTTSINQSSNSRGSYHGALEPEKGAAGSSYGNHEMDDDLETFWDMEQLNDHYDDKIL